MIEIQKVSVTYYQRQSSLLAVKDVSFSVGENEFACLLGPSGCGKSTILHLLAGFTRPTAGTIRVRGKLVTGPGVDRGVVFQQHSLFPWKTVWGNVEFGPRVKGVPPGKRREIVRRYLASVGLEEFTDSYPSELSVGMQQRVGLARAFANDPEILLMDEPFGSLDAQTRLRMQDLLLSIWNQDRKTVIFVTHDIDEAILLSDRILLLSPRPATVVEMITIDLPRPRNHLVLTSPECVRLKEKIMSLLFVEKNEKEKGN